MILNRLQQNDSRPIFDAEKDQGGQGLKPDILLDGENQNAKSVAEFTLGDQGKAPGDMSRLQERLPLARSRSESALSAS